MDSNKFNGVFNEIANANGFEKPGGWFKENPASLLGTKCD